VKDHTWVRDAEVQYVSYLSDVDFVGHIGFPRQEVNFRPYVPSAGNSGIRLSVDGGAASFSGSKGNIYVASVPRGPRDLLLFAPVVAATQKRATSERPCSRETGMDSSVRCRANCSTYPAWSRWL
jgi:hypothetical protein